MADGTAGGAILGLVEDAAKQLQDLIRKSSAQLRQFVEQSLAKIDARQKEAEDRLERATQAAEERARSAADDAIASMRSEIAAAEERQRAANDAALAEMRAAVAKHQAELEGIQGLAGQRLNISEAVGGFDFDGDGEPDEDGQVYYESEQREAVAQHAGPSAEDLEAIASRVFDRLAVEINAGRLSLGPAVGAAVARDDSVHLVTERDFDRFVKIATRGDEAASQLVTRFFYLVAAIDAAMSGNDEQYAELINRIEPEEAELRNVIGSCVDERIREREKAAAK